MRQCGAVPPLRRGVLCHRRQPRGGRGLYRMVSEAVASAPMRLSNWVGGRAMPADSGAYFEKRSPHDQRLLALVPRSGEADIDMAVREAQEAQPGWAELPAVQRG